MKKTEKNLRWKIAISAALAVGLWVACDPNTAPANQSLIGNWSYHSCPMGWMCFSGLNIDLRITEDSVFSRQVYYNDAIIQAPCNWENKWIYSKGVWKRTSETLEFDRVFTDSNYTQQVDSCGWVDPTVKYGLAFKGENLSLTDSGSIAIFRVRDFTRNSVERSP